MKNLFTNLMKNTAKRTQNAGGGTSHEKNSAVAVWNDGRTTVKRRSNDGQSQRRYNVSLWKYAAMILMLLCLGTGQMWGQTTIYNTGWEGGIGTWSGNLTITEETTNVRTGSKAIKGSYTGSNSAKNASQATGTTTTSSKSVYCHIIGWAKSANGTMKAQIGFTSSKKGSAVTLSTSSWTQITYVGSEINASTIILYKQGNGSSDKYDVYFDDVVSYYSSSNTTDVTAPSAATSASATTSSISWTNGTDSGTGATGRQTTSIWRRTSGDADDLTLNNQGVYAASATDQSGHWTCVSATVAKGTDAATSSYDGTFSAGDRYAIVHRDLAYNYSTPTYVTVASACSATANAGADKATTYGVGVEMAATAASSGFTGAWSIKTGSPSTAAGQLGTTSSNTMTFTPAAVGTYTLYWTVTNNSDATCKAKDSADVVVSKADMPSTGLATGTATSITASGATLPFTMTSTSGVGSLTIKVYTSSDDKVAKTISNITPATSGSQAVTGLSASTTYYYTITPIGDANHNDGDETSASSTFTTDAPECEAPTSPSISGTTSYTAGGTISLTASATGTDGSTTYQWYKGDPADSGVSQGDASTDGATFSKASCEVADAGTYYCVISNGAGCDVKTYQAITVAKASMPSTGLATGTATSITTSGATLPFTMTSTSGVGSLTIKVYDDGDELVKTISNITPATSGSEDVTGLSSSTTYYYTITPIGDANHNDGSETSASSTFTTLTVTYTVTYSKGSATGGTAPTDATPYSSGAEVTVKDTTGCKFVYAGYTFRGWTDGITFFLPGQKFNITGNTTLTAVWESNEGSCSWGLWWFYNESDRTASKFSENNLSFLSQGTSNTFSSVTYNGLTGSARTGNSTPSSKTFTIPSSKTGQLYFIGKGGSSRTIQLKQSSTVKYSVEPGSSEGSTCMINNIVAGTYELTSSGNIGWSVVAIKFCSRTNFDVTFNMKSHGSAVSSYVGVPTSKMIVAPTAPTESGYIFGGWYTDSGCTSEWDWESSTVTKDTTLYAKWTEKTAPTQYTVGGDTYYCPDETAEITLSGSQSGVSYQLKKGGSAQGDAKAGTGEALSWTGMTDGTYTISAVENATYAARDMSGSVTVSAASITAISTQPTTSVSAGASVNFTLGSDMVTAGHGLSHQWYSYSSSGGADEAAIDGAESATYTTSKSAGTYYYKVKVSGDCGDPVYSNMITVTVKTAPTVYELSGTTSVCEGNKATITLEDSDDGVTYQLYKGGVAEGDPVTGTGSALEWEVTAEGTYTVKAEEDATYAEATMEGSAVISYKTATAISTEPATAVSGHDGVNFTLGSDLDATGQGTLTYQWYSYSNSSGDDETTVGSATTTKTLTTSKSAGTYYYKVKVIGECGSEESSMITVTIDNKHLLTYDANGGEGAPDAEFRAAGTAALSATEPTRTNYRFLGWNTKDDGTGDHYAAGASYTMGSSAVTLYAEWGETATLTWNLNVNTAESSIGTASKASTNARISNSTDMTNLANYGSLTISSSAKENLTSKIETPTTYNSGKYMYVTFDVPEDYEFVPTSISVKVQPVGSGEDKYTILDISDENSHNIRSTATKCDGTKEGKLTTVSLEGDETALTGTVTLKIYVYNYSGESTTNNCYRLGSPITIAGNVNYVCPERATITSPTTAQSIKLYTDQSKTLSVSATAYAGTLNYQWQKDGADIDGATSATYTVVGSGLTVGTTYKYTCNVSETDPASCETVTSPAVSITAASPDCGYTEIASAVLTSASAATPTGCTARVNLGDKDGGDPEGCYKMTGKNKYFALILSQAFQVGDSIFFKLFTKTSIAAINIHATGATDTIGTLIHSRTLVSGDYGKDTIIGFVVTPEMATTLNTNKKVAIFRNNTDNKQNHCLYWIKVKRYVCADIVVFDNAKENGKWSDEGNWIGSTGHGATPTIDDRVVINKPMTVDVPNAKAKEIILDQSSSNTGKLTIGAGKALVVAGTIKTYDGSSYSATTPSDIVLESDAEHGTGALITGEASDNTQAAVQFYSKARYASGYVNQFIGVPLSSMTAYNGFYGTSLRVYDDTNDKWQVLGNNAAMYPFTAYNLMRKEATAGTLYMEGALNLPGTGGKQELTITRRTSEVGSSRSDHLFANSWTAPIDIASMDEDDFDGADATIYIFNAGTTSDYGTNGGNYTTKKTTNPGQWLYMPVNAVKETSSDFSLTVIPSMQAFMVHCAADNLSEAGGTTHTLTLDYKKHVYDPAKTSGAAIVANRAPRREASEAKHEIIRVRVEGTSGYADDLLLFIGNDFSNGYDNGWEAYKVSGKAYTPQLYAVTEDGKKAISAQPDADNTVIGFKAGTEDDVYTFTLNYEGNDASLYLHDTYTDDYVRVEKDATYTFLTTDNTDHPRFVLTRFNAPQVTTGVDDVQWNGSKARKLMIDGILYIIRDGRIYNAEGALVK